MLLQDLPPEILLLVFNHLEYRCLASVVKGRALAAAFELYLRYHPTFYIRNGTGQEYDNGYQPIADFLSQVTSSRTVARSVRRVVVEIRESWSKSTVAISKQTGDWLQKAVRFKPDTFNSISKLRADNDVMVWLLPSLLACENLESIRVDTEMHLGWHYTAQHLDYTQWPHNSLTNLDVDWILEKESSKADHGLQDVWLPFTAPSLRTIRLQGLRQQNSLYAGIADRAAIRTIYWPIELEDASLYTYQLHQKDERSWHKPFGLPQSLPTPPAKLLISHGFTALETLKLDKLSIPATWFPSIFSCFTALRSVRIGLPERFWSSGPSRPLPDLRLLKLALEQHANTLEELKIAVDLYVPGQFAQAAACGYVSVGSLNQMHQLKRVSLPWYAWLPEADPSMNSDRLWAGDKIAIGPNLEEIVLCNTQTAKPETLNEIVRRAAVAGESQSLQQIVLWGGPDMAVDGAVLTKWDNEYRRIAWTNE